MSPSNILFTFFLLHRTNYILYSERKNLKKKRFSLRAQLDDWTKQSRTMHLHKLFHYLLVYLSSWYRVFKRLNLPPNSCSQLRNHLLRSVSKFCHSSTGGYKVDYKTSEIEYGVAFIKQIWWENSLKSHRPPPPGSAKYLLFSINIDLMWSRQNIPGQLEWQDGVSGLSSLGHDVSKNVSNFDLVAMVTIRGLLLTKHCNKRNSKLNVACSLYLGRTICEYIAHKTMKPVFWWLPCQPGTDQLGNFGT